MPDLSIPALTMPGVLGWVAIIIGVIGVIAIIAALVTGSGGDAPPEDQDHPRDDSE